MINVAVNGFGRIGRVFTRVLQGRSGMRLAAVNDLAGPDTLAHLLRYDSVHGRFSGTVQSIDGGLVINGQSVKVFSEKDPSKLPWKELDIHCVVECTGQFRDRKGAGLHLAAGAQRVIISAPAKDDDVATVVLGVNDEVLNDAGPIVSNASCTTNSAAPMIAVLDRAWGVGSGYITTVHSYTTDQRLHDAPHSDLRRARAAAYSIVPTTTGAAKAITRIFPHLEGKMGGCGIRVPVPDGSLTDLTCILREAPASIDAVNDRFREAAAGELKGILSVTEDPVVSIDIVGDPHSCIFDPGLTSVLGNMVKVVGWYDNEMGYSHRLADLAERLAKA